MSRYRKDRVAGLIREAVSDIIRLKIKDPRVSGVTITEVRMTPDLKSARVYFSSMSDGMGDLHKKGLEAATGFIRHQLGLELDLRYIPSLAFVYDTSFDNFDRINRILQSLELTENTDDSTNRTDTPQRGSLSRSDPPES
ncbi:MAG: 30S ribosome-binding factor RbfA [Desulfomonile sp.]|nr:30S ribosome-binding factor RbfA [Desulfomonile sp.]